MNRKSYVYCLFDNSYTQILVSQNIFINDVNTYKYNEAEDLLKDSLLVSDYQTYTCIQLARKAFIEANRGFFPLILSTVCPKVLKDDFHSALRSRYAHGVSSPYLKSTTAEVYFILELSDNNHQEKQKDEKHLNLHKRGHFSCNICVTKSTCKCKVLPLKLDVVF